MKFISPHNVIHLGSDCSQLTIPSLPWIPLNLLLRHFLTMYTSIKTTMMVAKSVAIPPSAIASILSVDLVCRKSVVVGNSVVFVVVGGFVVGGEFCTES